MHYYAARTGCLRICTKISLDVYQQIFSSDPYCLYCTIKSDQINCTKECIVSRQFINILNSTDHPYFLSIYRLDTVLEVSM